jgi:outer membrane protein assembly factor BamA
LTPPQGVDTISYAQDGERECDRMMNGYAKGVTSAVLVAALLVRSGVAHAQEAPGPTGWEPNGLPALNYDSDEGFGYGALLELYNYGNGGHSPYRFTIQPTVFLTTGGRRDFTLFFDAPHLLPAGWRIDVDLGSEKQIATPYYGPGNATIYDESLEDEHGQYYYRFGRTRRGVATNLQRAVAGLPLRILLGVGLNKTTIEVQPEDAVETLLRQDYTERTVPSGWTNHVRIGLVWDTRDQETGPTSGAWTEILVQGVPEFLGSETGYIRWTFADRRYFPLGGRVTFANRFMIQDIDGVAPFYDQYLVQSSFKSQEGLGGAKTLRGIPKNRYVGKGMFLWNAELRWRVGDFEMLGRSLHVVLSGFVDSGRVWEDGLQWESLVTDLHTGVGGGVRVGVGENFVVALDLGHSSEATAPFYIGLGYLF